MSYIIKSSEKLRPSAAENETKALLYLMSFMEDSDEVYYFIVDLFNDLTGMCRLSDKLWDIQSKGKKRSSAKDIGAELVTLFKNYTSDFNFSYYILFLGGVTSKIRIDNNIFSFKIDNIKEEAISDIKRELKNECNKKTYIDKNTITDDNICNFLQKVYFIVNNKEKSDYIKSIIKLNESIIPSKNLLEDIFNEIRDIQCSKKNSQVVEGMILETPDEAINLGRHLTSNEIRLLVLNRVINNDVMNKDIPMIFLEIIDKLDKRKRAEIVDECQMSLSRALFDINSKDIFWNILENIYTTLITNPEDSIEEIYRKLDKGILRKSKFLNILATKYFIAIVKGGLNI